MRFQNKVAIVTGAASGIGRATATRLAHEGATVAIADTDGHGANETASSIDRAGGTASVWATDVGDADDVNALVNGVLEQHGRIDALVNNAAVWLPDDDADVVNLKREVWDRVLLTNLTSVFLLCRRVIPRMLEQDGGAIVNVASIAALNGWKNMDAYTASKGGVVSISRSMAAEYGPRIRVNAVCPGAVRTPLTAEQQDLHGFPPNPMQRVGQPADLAAVIAFLVSDEAAFVTGQTYTVDGGSSIRQ